MPPMRGNRSDGAGNTRPGIRVPVAMPGRNRNNRNDFADIVAFFCEIACRIVHPFSDPESAPGPLFPV